MTWLNPWGWLWLGLSIPIILLFVLRIRRRRVPVATTQFWEEILMENRPRAWWQRLRHLASLLLQLLLLLLLVAAIADPLSASQSRDRRYLILLVDRSASMNARTGDAATRFEEAIRLAHRELEGLRERDEAIVVSFADDLRIECGRTSYAGLLHQALDAITPSDRVGDVRRALALARRLHALDRVKEVVVFTDAPLRNESPDQVPNLHTQEGIRWRMVGDDAANVAITGLSARARADRRTEFRILVRLANFSEASREVSAALRLDGQPIDAITAELAAGEEKTFTVSKVLPSGGRLEVALNVDDALDADNVAWLLIPPPQPIRVAVVSARANWFLEHALSAVPLVEVIRVNPGEPASAEEYDVVVFDQVSPGELPPVHSLFLHPGEASPLWRMGEPLERVLISSIDAGSPLLRYTRFERVAIRAAQSIAPDGGRTVLGSFGAPLLHVWDGSEIRRAALTIDLEQSDLALRTAFPILMANLVQWFTGNVTGDITGLKPGEDARFERVGQYASEDGEHCVNLADAGESDLRQSSVGAEVARLGSAVSRPWWRWLAMAALALVTVEWGLHQRRWVE